MAITPINGISVKQNSNNMVNFTGRKRTEDSEENLYEQNVPRRSNKMATVPVVVLMAMTPGMMNGKQPITVLPANAINMTEILAPAEKAEETGNTYYMNGINQSSQNLPEILSNENVQYKESFRVNGKKYTMYYIDYLKGQKGESNQVNGIYFVPEDFKLIMNPYGLEGNSAPEMVQFRYHKVSDDINNNFVGAVLHQQICDSKGNNTKFKTWEIRLPDEIANKILSLILGDLELKPSKGIVDSYVHVTTPNLMPTKIENPVNR